MILAIGYLGMRCIPTSARSMVAWRWLSVVGYRACDSTLCWTERRQGSFCWNQCMPFRNSSICIPLTGTLLAKNSVFLFQLLNALIRWSVKES
jgi:hypothetical protein